MRKIRILFLANDPSDLARLRLGQELRDIRERLQLARQGDNFLLESREAVRPRDITQVIFDVEPQIVHFSGHGMSTGELCFEDNLGKMRPVQPDALANLFELVAQQVNCVILNACYSEVQAKAIAQHIPFVIGMNQAIGDKAAIAFAVGFYRALGAGRSIEDAYRFGRVEIQIEGIPEHLTPVLYAGQRSDKPSEPPPLDYQSWLRWVRTTAQSSLGRFWLQWVLANLAGGLVAMATSIQGESIGVVLGGTAIGLAQWLVIRRQVDHAYWWMLATIVGWIAGWKIGGELILLASRHQVGKIAVGMAIIQITIGLAQSLMLWLVLRKQVSTAGWWLLAVAGSGALEVLVVNFTGWTYTWPVSWIIFGATTGSAMVWLLQSQRIRASSWRS